MAQQYNKYPNGGGKSGNDLVNGNGWWYDLDNLGGQNAEWTDTADGIKFTMADRHGVFPEKSAITLQLGGYDQHYNSNVDLTAGQYCLHGAQIRFDKKSERSDGNVAIGLGGTRNTQGTEYHYAPALFQADYEIGQWTTIPTIIFPYPQTQWAQHINALYIQINGYEGNHFSVRHLYIYKIGDGTFDPHTNDIVSSDAGITSDIQNDSLTVNFTKPRSSSRLVQIVEWDYGDGSPIEDGAAQFGGDDPRKRTHTFPTAGEYNVKVTVKNTKQTSYVGGTTEAIAIWQTATKTTKIKVPTGPYTANFISQSDYLDADVDGSSSVGAIIDDWEWDWGDGTITHGKISSHSYEAGGDYPVKLTISNSLGESNTVTKIVTVKDIPVITTNFSVVRDLLKVTFSPNVSGGAFLWNFGDGQTSTEESPIHYYETSGSYTVTLTYTPTGGSASSVQKDVTVYAKFRPIDRFADAIRLEIKRPPEPGEIVNLIKNPNGELGGYGWVTPTATGKMVGSDTDTGPDDHGVTGWKLIFSNDGGAAQTFQSEYAKVTPGDYIAASWQVPYIDNYYRQWITFYDINLAVVSSTPMGAYLNGNGSSRRSLITQVPANAVWASLVFGQYENVSGGNPAGPHEVMQLRRVIMATADTSAELENLTYIENAQWINIIEPSFSISIERAELDIGTLGASIRDAQYDPAKHDIVKPGQGVRCRVSTEDGFGNQIWEPIYTGELLTAEVTYDRQNIITVPGTPAVPETVVRTNGCMNPSFETNLNGWGNAFNGALTREAVHPFSGAYAGKFVSTAAGNSFVYYGRSATSLRTACVEGDVVQIRERVWTAQAGINAAIYVQFYDVNMNEIANIAGTAGLLTQNGTTELSGQATAPTNTAYVGFCPLFNAAAPITVWIDGNDIDINSSSVISDTSYFDGATADTGEFVYGWVGTAHNSASTKSTPAVPATDTTYITEDDPSRTVIELLAVDNDTLLGSISESRGVYEMSELPFILEGKGVPYIINGSSDQVTSAQIVAANDNATLIDQIAITRDTQSGYAFVDRHNVLVAYDSVAQPTDVRGIFDEGKYSGIEAKFSTDQCINYVTIKFMRYNPTTGETSEVMYGPYTDDASIEEWGLHDKEFTIYGLVENAANIEMFANDILAKSATPVTKVSNITLPIAFQDDIDAKALRDLYDLVNVKYSNSNIDENTRIISISHKIELDGWEVELGFSVDGAVATPQSTPSPPTGGTEIIEDTWHVVGDAGEPAFQNGATANTSRPLMFKRDPSGNLHIKGTFNPNGIANNATIFTLPVGYIPKDNVYALGPLFFFDVMGARIDVLTSGEVKAWGMSTGTREVYFGERIFYVGDA